ncbi:MAG TPA: pseudouridine synthase [Patescibacteria group bacterium]|jgi:23S rRNA pseudouridine2605 synthase|nr:pseudouridine synthase [Patescibacteria group bacterium]
MTADQASSTRLNKYLARHTGISRREADDLIAAQRVNINQDIANIGSQVQPGDIVSVDGAPIESRTTATTLVMHKPVGYVCSRRQQGDSPTVYSLLPEVYQSLKTVGRLDRDSSGVILLTDDGDFSHQMTHPSFYKIKIYEVSLDSPLQPLHRQMISDFGVMLEDGKSQFELERLGDDDLSWRISMREGRNRQIRRTFGALGYDVRRLHRTSFGSYTLGDIPAGLYKKVDIS